MASTTTEIIRTQKEEDRGPLIILTALHRVETVKQRFGELAENHRRDLGVEEAEAVHGVVADRVDVLEPGKKVRKPGGVAVHTALSIGRGVIT